MLYSSFRYYGVVSLLPIFQYSNVYAATPNLRMLAENKVLQQRCIKYVSKSGMFLLPEIHVENCDTDPCIPVNYCTSCMRHSKHSTATLGIRHLEAVCWKGFQ